MTSLNDTHAQNNAELPNHSQQRPSAPPPSPNPVPSYANVRAALARRHFAILGTTSATNLPHAVGVVYAEVDGTLYISTDRGSRKARNIASNPNVFVNVPVRRVPFGAPPSSIQFRTTAELLDPNHDDVQRLVASGRLRAITGHGELDLPNGCIVRVSPARLVHTYGLGMSLRALARDPLNAFATVVAE